MLVWSLGHEDPMEDDVKINSSILAWKIPWTQEPDGYSPQDQKEYDMSEVTQQAHLPESYDTVIENCCIEWWVK